MRNSILYALFFLCISAIIIQSCQNEAGLNYQRYFVNGKGLYEKHCQNCHGADGKGLGKLYPPLTDSTYLKNNKNNLACIIKHGQSGQITINNVIYEGEMPANESLADIEIAQIIVYITNSFGNDQGFYETSQITADLRNCP